MLRFVQQLLSCVLRSVKHLFSLVQRALGGVPHPLSQVLLHGWRCVAGKVEALMVAMPSKCVRQ